MLSAYRKNSSLDNKLRESDIYVAWNGSRCNATSEYWMGFAVK